MPTDDLPPLPPGAPGRPPRERYREQYGLIIVCADEVQQRGLYDALQVLRSAPIRVVVT